MLREPRGDAQTSIFPEFSCANQHCWRKEYQVQFGRLTCLTRRDFGTDRVQGEFDGRQSPFLWGSTEHELSTLFCDPFGAVEHTPLPVHCELFFADLGKLNGIRFDQRNVCFQTYLENTLMWDEPRISRGQRLDDTCLVLYQADIVSPCWERDDDGMPVGRWDGMPKGFASTNI